MCGIALEKIERIIPWNRWVAIIKPHYYKGERENKPYDLELMFRLYVLQNLYSNLYHAMFEVVHDDVDAHDLLFPSCSKAMYDFFYQNGTDHPNCLDNIIKELHRR